MSNGFMATGQTTTTAPATHLVTNNGFFPDIDLVQLRGAVRLPSTVTEERLRHAVIEAVISVNGELAAWAAERRGAYAQLADVPQEQIGGAGALVSRYRNAVYCSAKADLSERYRDIDTTASGEEKAERLDATIGDERRAARWAISDFLGKSRSTIELI